MNEAVYTLAILALAGQGIAAAHVLISRLIATFR